MLSIGRMLGNKVVLLLIAMAWFSYAVTIVHLSSRSAPPALVPSPTASNVVLPEFKDQRSLYKQQNITTANGTCALLRDGSHPDLHGPKLCVVIRTMDRQVLRLSMLIQSLLMSNYINIGVYVLPTETIDDVVDPVTGYVVNSTAAPLLYRFVSQLNDCRVQMSPVKPLRDLNPYYVQDYGYIATQQEMRRLGRETDCEYILFTNGDNYYHNEFLQEVSPYLNKGTDMVAVSFVSHHTWTGRGKNILVEKRTVSIPLDLGACIISMRVVRQCSFLPRDVTDGRKDNWFTRDRFFFQQALSIPDVTTVAIPQILFMHQ